MIELRSDTFTEPTSRMRSAMAEAVVGNDDYGEDPTVRDLERQSAHRLGKEAACLMPSGTMANLSAILSHAPRGSKVIVGDESDIYLYEAAGAAVCGGVSYEPVRNRSDGTLPLDALAAAYPPDDEDPQFAPVGLICLENTQNRCGGAVLTPHYQSEVARLAAARATPMHLDGARIFNAAVASATPVAELAVAADSVQFCLSKGLGAPIGSVLVGDGAFIAKARRIRKMLGGGMRQAGTVAAAGLVALDEMVDRLAEDHHHARLLAEGLAAQPAFDLDPKTVQTNIVLFRLSSEETSEEAFLAAARRRGVALLAFGHGRIRAVTHLGVGLGDMEAAITAMAAAAAETAGSKGRE
ncbi:GntG family PLP-dependent aldolase [Catellatospora chokoriensis]|uniref:Threonine aldolase n=1 Tax=Catellatospora chokoriensis TaxID=310353 RepID=A0A8J3NPX1_9ACTN|nr:GntG family PLP-dependent aldolase [Catellatospora chokoriensis]GIF87658.1 threonine aldolase [Catellatospora chokoriensis]